LGAAYLAGLAVGVYRQESELTALWREQRRFMPNMSRDQAHEKMNVWAGAVRQARAN
jgi:glycerol kinase